MITKRHLVSNAVMLKILLLEDDLVLLETLSDELSLEGYSVDTAKHGKEFFDLSFKNSYHLYILDINVPFIDGLTLLQELRNAEDNTAAIFLTSNNTEQNKIDGFEIGCDDYLVKPFSLHELKLRVKALFRRIHQENFIHYDDILIDRKHYQLKIDDKEVVVDKKVIDILHLFISQPNTILTLDDIMESAYTEKVPTATVIRVHISKINALFEKKRIINVRGVGYRYEKS